MTPQLRPVSPADEPAFRRFLEGLSERSAYLRFLGGGVPGGAQERALLGHGGVLAWDGAEVVGHASCHPVPGAQSDAELSVVVADGWQQRGLGPRLAAAAIARATAVRRLHVVISADNQPALTLAAEPGPRRRRGGRAPWSSSSCRSAEPARRETRPSASAGSRPAMMTR